MDVSRDTMQVYRVAKGGCIDSYNRSCKPGYQLVPGDTIVEVNDVNGDIELMMEEIQTPTRHRFRFTVARG